MPQSRMPEIADQLIHLTTGKMLKWDKTIRTNEYQVSFPDLTFKIQQDENGGYHLNLIGETGQPVDTMSSTPEKTTTSDQQLAEIYQLAETEVRETTTDRALDYLSKTAQKSSNSNEKRR